jgi:glycosyltransferase involved in cell wall biosynthesis
VPRIVFLCPFAKHEITGGIKTIHRQAALLSEAGFEACVYQPDGPPSWFESRVKVLTARQFAAQPSDVLVFPETLNGPLAELAQARLPAKKVLFCQAHYYLLFNSIPAERIAHLGFDRVICQSAVAKGFLERVLQFSDVAVVPCYIDREVFFPRAKKPQITFIPRKLPREAASIQKIFALKYRHFDSVPWIAIDNRSERELAEIFGTSTIVLSLPFLESFGLVPLEAMASGALVLGFHGYGGQEYATPENGFWFPPDHLEEVADMVARIITGLERNDPDLLKVREAGFATAARYNRETTLKLLCEVYAPLVEQ